VTPLSLKAETPAPLAVAIHSGNTGAESVQVSGKAAAYSLVSLDLWAEVSEDIPSIWIGSQTITADNSGKFSTTVNLAPVYERGIRVTVRASIEGGRVTETASTLITAPNAFNPDWDNTTGSH
jgi:hypothetical protein